MYYANSLDNPNYNFLGYIWFVGRIVNIFDPEKLGRVKIRIFGRHSFDINELPTEHLPWSNVSGGFSASRTFEIGDIVYGYFEDRDGQKPFILSKIESIKTQREPYLGELTQEEKNKLPIAAKKIFVEFPGQPGNPLILGEETSFPFTTVHIANENRVHVCDITNEMQRSAAWVRLKFSEFMKFIRDGIRALLAALGTSPEGVSARIKELAQAVVRGLKKVQKVLATIQEAIAVFNNFIKKVNELIAYILSLPANLIAMLRDCLNNLYASLSKGFSDLFKDTNLGGDFSAIVQVAQETQKTINSAVETTAKAAESAALLASTVATVGTAGQQLKRFKI